MAMSRIASLFMWCSPLVVWSIYPECPESPAQEVQKKIGGLNQSGPPIEARALTLVRAAGKGGNLLRIFISLAKLSEQT